MLSNAPYYWGTIRRTVEAFASLFTDIHIVRVNDTVDPAETKTIQVPIRYGPKEKWYVRNTQNPMPGVDDQVEMVLPIMSFEITGFTYDSSRKLTSTGMTMKSITDQTRLKTQFNPVPYNIGFELNAMVKNVEDGLMIIEQIVPFFTPDYTISVNDMPDLALSKDVPIVLNSVTSADDWEGDFKQRRTITWTLQFTVKAYLYPPVALKKVILDSIGNVLLDGTSTSIGSVEVTPTSVTIT